MLLEHNICIVWNDDTSKNEVAKLLEGRQVKANYFHWSEDILEVDAIEALVDSLSALSRLTDVVYICTSTTKDEQDESIKKTRTIIDLLANAGYNKEHTPFIINGYFNVGFTTELGCIASYMIEHDDTTHNSCSLTMYRKLFFGGNAMNRVVSDKLSEYQTGVLFDYEENKQIVNMTNEQCEGMRLFHSAIEDLQKKFARSFYRYYTARDLDYMDLYRLVENEKPESLKWMLTPNDVVEEEYTTVEL